MYNCPTFKAESLEDLFKQLRSHYGRSGHVVRNITIVITDIDHRVLT